jgi:hypothetical protein
VSPWSASSQAAVASPAMPPPMITVRVSVFVIGERVAQLVAGVRSRSCRAGRSCSVLHGVPADTVGRKTPGSGGLFLAVRGGWSSGAAPRLCWTWHGDATVARLARGGGGGGPVRDLPPGLVAGRHSFRRIAGGLVLADPGPGSAAGPAGREPVVSPRPTAGIQRPHRGGGDARRAGGGPPVGVPRTRRAARGGAGGCASASVLVGPRGRGGGGAAGQRTAVGRHRALAVLRLPMHRASRPLRLGAAQDRGRLAARGERLRRQRRGSELDPEPVPSPVDGHGAGHDGVGRPNSDAAPGRYCRGGGAPARRRCRGEERGRVRGLGHEFVAGHEPGQADHRPSGARGAHRPDPERRPVAHGRGPSLQPGGDLPAGRRNHLARR